MSEKVIVIGGVNMDIAAGLTAPFVAADSVPGRVTLGCGGVARNIAHNLRLMGHEVRFVSLFGGETFGQMCWQECQSIGLELGLSERRESLRNGLYLCVNDLAGEMVAAVADTDIVEHITPAFIERRLADINSGAAVVADTNLSAESLRCLMDHCTAPLVIDTVSTAKAHRALEALARSKTHRLDTLKLNLKEARAVTGQESPRLAAGQLLERGVGEVYITLGEDGVYCANGQCSKHYPALPATVVNTTGAGDAFVAGVVHARLRLVPFPQRAQVGLRAARATLLCLTTVNPDIAQLCF